MQGAKRGGELLDDWPIARRISNTLTPINQGIYARVSICKVARVGSAIVYTRLLCYSIGAGKWEGYPCLIFVPGCFSARNVFVGISACVGIIG